MKMMSFLIIMCILFLSSCQTTSKVPQNESSIEHEKNYVEIDPPDEKADILFLEDIIRQKQGYVNLSNEDFLQKARELEFLYTTDNSIEIFGSEPYDDPNYSGISVCYYFNDSYILSMQKNISIVVSDIDTKQIVYIKTVPIE